MVIGKPAPVVRACVDAVAAAMRTHQPHHALSVTQRTWLACCLTAVLVTHAMCWARCARASVGTSAMAALSWRFRHQQDALGPAYPRVPCPVTHHGTIAVTSARRAAG